MEKQKKEAHGYDISEYELIYIIFKDKAAFSERNSELVKFDSKKKKFYVKGKAVKLRILNPAGGIAYDYPNYRTIALVHENDIMKYTQAKNDIKRQEMLKTIHFGDIDYITATFDSLDWLK